MESKDWTAPAVSELVGTFFLVFVGAGSIIIDAHAGGLGLLGIALAHGLALSIAVTAAMNISGGHINPAVTIGMLFTGRIGGGMAFIYVVSQLVGGLLGALALNLFYPAASAAATNLGAPALAEGVSLGQAVGIEAVLTFLLMYSIFGTAVDERAPNIGGFGIGLAVTFDILAGGPLTGAAMNPARAFGPALVAGFWTDQLVYWIGPIIGAAAAAFVYDGFVTAGGDVERRG